MKMLQIIERYRYMDKLIRAGRTGSAREFAEQVGVSRSQLFNYFDELRSMDIDIRYDPLLRSYTYTGDTEVEIRMPIRVLCKKEMEARGGQIISLPVQGYWTTLDLGLYRECS
ncbi:MAG: hypothetical protein ACOYXB_00495 [Bacteroidota bacterium]